MLDHGDDPAKSSTKLDGRRQYFATCPFILTCWQTVRLWCRSSCTELNPNSTWLSRHDTRYLSRAFGCFELVEQHGSTRSSQRARHVERVVSRGDVTWRAKWNSGFSRCGNSTQSHQPTRFFPDQLFPPVFVGKCSPCAECYIRFDNESRICLAYRDCLLGGRRRASGFDLSLISSRRFSSSHKFRRRNVPSMRTTRLKPAVQVK